MAKLNQKYLESLCEDIYYYIEERCALDGINLSNMHPIKIYVAKNNKEFIGHRFDHSMIFKKHAKISIELCSIEQEEM